MDSVLESAPTVMFNMLAKTKIDVKRHEVNRGIRVLNDHTWHHVSFVRKPKDKKKFQAKLYPPFMPDHTEHKYKRWADGKECKPKLF